MYTHACVYVRTYGVIHAAATVAHTRASEQRRLTGPSPARHVRHGHPPSRLPPPLSLRYQGQSMIRRAAGRYLSPSPVCMMREPVTRCPRVQKSLRLGIANSRAYGPRTLFDRDGIMRAVENPAQERPFLRSRTSSPSSFVNAKNEPQIHAYQSYYVLLRIESKQVYTRKVWAGCSISSLGGS